MPLPKNKSDAYAETNTTIQRKETSDSEQFTAKEGDHVEKKKNIGECDRFSTCNFQITIFDNISGWCPKKLIFTRGVMQPRRHDATSTQNINSENIAYK